MEYLEKNIEYMERDEIDQLQLERLQATLNRVYKNVSHYRKTFTSIGFMPEDLKSVKELEQLPFTTRQDLKDNYPYGMFAVPLREVVRLHSPAISFDKPIVMGLTVNDLKQWSRLIARNLKAIGLTKDDVVHLALPFRKMSSTFGIKLGTEQIGASVIPISDGKFCAQAKIMRDFRTTVLITIPPFGLGLIRAMEAQGIDPHSLSLKHGIFGFESWSDETRHRLESKMHITATDMYGLTEMASPGVAFECLSKSGLHINEDQFIPEIIDTTTLKPLPPGHFGELVLTSISKEASPLIRFRTGDITALNYGTCDCGRTHCRMSRIKKRCDDVVVMRGICVIPDHVGFILKEHVGHIPNYQLIVERIDDQDKLTVLMEISDTTFFDEMKAQRKLMDELHYELSEFLGFEVAFRLVEPGALAKEKRVIDRRIAGI
ncbi:MAG: phenylacetate--CoA ligase [Desulfobacterales bacterium]|nr:phenylacetate--CoA ligase [Desulfobacterales bacterium]